MSCSLFDSSLIGVSDDTYQASNLNTFMNIGKNKERSLKALIDQKSQGQRYQQKSRDVATVLQNFRKTLLISLKAYDESSAIRVIVYTRNFLDLPLDLIEGLNLTQ